MSDPFVPLSKEELQALLRHSREGSNAREMARSALHYAREAEIWEQRFRTATKYEKKEMARVEELERACEGCQRESDERGAKWMSAEAALAQARAREKERLAKYGERISMAEARGETWVDCPLCDDGDVHVDVLTNALSKTARGSLRPTIGSRKPGVPSLAAWTRRDCGISPNAR